MGSLSQGLLPHYGAPGAGEGPEPPSLRWGLWEEQGEVSSAVEGRQRPRAAGRPEGQTTGGWAGVSKGRKGPEQRDGGGRVWSVNNGEKV